MFGLLTNVICLPACGLFPSQSLGAYEIYAIGRASRWVQNGARYEMDTVIANPKISNVHCKIWREYDPNDPEPEFTATVMLEDCSSNGTYLNGERLGKGVIRFLEGGDEISLGNPHGDVLPIEDQYRKRRKRHNVLPHSAFAQV